MAGIQSRIILASGDITHLEVDAVVTAANQALMGGGGVDGAVHLAAGPKLVDASRKLAPCAAGDARVTPAFNLHVSYVIHAVGPIYRDGDAGEPALLASAYRNSLRLSAENRIGHIAFPCISTGAYGFPNQLACEIAISTVIEWLKSHEYPNAVTFCCFRPDDYQLYSERLVELGCLESD